MTIPVVDVFAGPGGLAEGFASITKPDGRPAFDVILSVEKEEFAHRTLTLRKLVRQVGPAAERRMFAAVQRGAAPEDILAEFEGARRDAEERALRLELGRQTGEAVEAARRRIAGRDPWILIGGPPCQAYSLVGRARRSGDSDYVAEADARQTLYVEYLQLLADCEPAAFVMENVKGLLSATLSNQRLFDRITNDLRDPATALRREGRQCRGKPRYDLYAFRDDGFSISDNAADYVVRAETLGVPQARHRVIVIGIRAGGRVTPPAASENAAVPVTLKEALKGLPRLRSGISREPDSAAEWLTALTEVGKADWTKHLPKELAHEVREQLQRLCAPRADRGGEAILDSHGNAVFNHASRSHIRSDLHRYFFAASFARLFGRSPVLADFPKLLLPKHKNVGRALKDGVFNDRFRVQLSNAPSTTVTSHIAKDGHYYIHPDPTQCRSLTVREAARLQTFPEDYVFCGPRTSQYLQVGNAVPPLLAARIGEALARSFA